MIASDAPSPSVSNKPIRFKRFATTRWMRLLWVCAGIVAGQCVIYGPSLIGKKILLPLDILAIPGVYLPETGGGGFVEPQDRCLSDLVLQFEPERRFAVLEMHAGRFPTWASYQFAGVPFVWPKLSPILLFQCLTQSPVILAWSQLLCALIAGLGMYVFTRRALAVHFWPAAVVAWCYPLTGFFIFWQGYWMTFCIYWLPWHLLTVHQTLRAPSLFNIAKLSVTSFLVFVSGRIDFAGQVLLASGIFALGCLVTGGWPKLRRSPPWRKLLALALGVALGGLLAAPHLAPFLDYTKSSSRVIRRAAGEKDFPPIGLRAIPQVVIPDFYGSTSRNSYFIAPPGTGNLLESVAGGYAGLLTCLIAAPLAWGSRRHRRVSLVLVFLVLLGFGWCLNLPGFVHFLRLPGVNMMSHNRLVFVSACAMLGLAAIGLDCLVRRQFRWRWQFWLPVAVLGICFITCLSRTLFSPVSVATELQSAVRAGNPEIINRLGSNEGARQVHAWFVRHGSISTVLCATGVVGWLLLRFRPAWRKQVAVGVMAIMACDLLWFASGRNPQCDPDLYYPQIPVLQQIANSPSERVIGYSCLPASLAPMCGLRDIRGYDAADPARLMDVVMIAADPSSLKPRYALTQWLKPKIGFSPTGQVQLSPILDMLNVRHVIFRGSPFPGVHPAYMGLDYWAVVNSNALPRVFIPSRALHAKDSILEKLASPQFNPHEVAYVESPVDVPLSCRGLAEIISERPGRIEVALNMETAGLVVFSELWDAGWRAFLDGRELPVLRANHAIQGVVVPPGTNRLEFRYWPASLGWSLCLSAVALMFLTFAGGAQVWKRRRLKS